MTARADAGDIVDQEAVPIGPDDTAFEVQKRVTRRRPDPRARASRSSKAGTAPRRPQDDVGGDDLPAAAPGRRAHRLDAPGASRSTTSSVPSRIRIPGAFTDVFGGKTFVWKTRLPHLGAHDNFPGQVRAEQGRLYVACGDDRYVEILSHPARGAERDRRAALPVRGGVSMKVLILGVNGFIGNALTERILKTTDWEVSGLDIASDKIAPFLGHPRFTYLEGDIAINKEWIEYQVKKCDVVLPLVAIATPAAYVRQPLAVFAARLRGEPAHRQAGRPLRQARRLPLDLRGLRHVPGRGVRRGELAARLRPDPASSAGSTPARSSSSTASSRRTGRRRGCASRSSARSTGSARTWTTSTRPRRARAAS